MRCTESLLRPVIIAALVCCVAASVYAERWERVGPEGGSVISLVVMRNGEVLLGTADGHVFASHDGGEHWELRGRVGKRFDGVVQGLIADSQAKSRVYAAVWTQDPAAGGGVFRSEDDGSTWASAGLQGEAVRALAQSASNPELLIAGTRTGVFRSEDAGRNWERISPAGDKEMKNLDSIAIDPRDANVIYAGTYHLPWKTADGGKSWKPVAAGMIDDSDVMSMVIDRGDPERIFASACSGIYRSENGGLQWTKLQGIPYVSRRTQQIVQDPLNAAVWYSATTEGLWRSGDGGESWTRATGRDVVVNGITFTGKGKTLMLGTDEGILQSTDGAKRFIAKNEGFTHPVVRALAVSETDSQHLLIALEKEGNGLRESVDGGKSWRAFPAPAVVVDELFSIGESWYASLRGGGAASFDLKTKNWTQVRFLVREKVRLPNKDGNSPTSRTLERLFKPDVKVLRAEGGRLFAATSDGLWASGMRTGVMQRVPEKQISGRITDLDANGAGNELFVVAQSKVARSVDGGKTWDSVNVPESLGELLWIRAENRETRAVLVGSSAGVYEYEYGASWKEAHSWKQLQSGLPGAASWPAALSGKIWLISMKAGGVYISKDWGGSWEWSNADDAGLVQMIEETKVGYAWARTQTDGLLLIRVEAP